ncbi:MAG: twin-arginine translocation signal domain-containing protein, partial [Hyphomicrobium sp.]
MSTKDTPTRSKAPILDRMPDEPPSADRRQFLRSSIAVAGAAVATGASIGAANAQKLEIPPSNKEPGRILEPKVYGLPSKYEAHVKRHRTDVLV